MSPHSHGSNHLGGRGEDGPSLVDCSEALMRVYEYLDGEMTPEESSRIAQHLDTCAQCLRQYDIDTTLKAIVRRSCQPEPAPPQLRSLIMSRIQITVIRTDDR